MQEVCRVMDWVASTTLDFLAVLGRAVAEPSDHISQLDALHGASVEMIKSHFGFDESQPSKEAVTLVYSLVCNIKCSW